MIDEILYGMLYFCAAVGLAFLTAAGISAFERWKWRRRR